MAQACPCHPPLVPFTPAWYVPPSGPLAYARPVCLAHRLDWFFSMSPNFSVLALTCSGTEAKLLPLHPCRSLMGMNGNFSPGIEGLLRGSPGSSSLLLGPWSAGWFVAQQIVCYLESDSSAPELASSLPCLCIRTSGHSHFYSVVQEAVLWLGS